MLSSSRWQVLLRESTWAGLFGLLIALPLHADIAMVIELEHGQSLACDLRKGEKSRQMFSFSSAALIRRPDLGALYMGGTQSSMAIFNPKNVARLETSRVNESEYTSIVDVVIEDQKMREQAFGLSAKFLKETVTLRKSASGCGRQGAFFERQGWFVEVPDADEDPIDLVSLGFDPGCRSTVALAWTGLPHPGLFIEGTTVLHNGLGPEQRLFQRAKTVAICSLSDDLFDPVMGASAPLPSEVVSFFHMPSSKIAGKTLIGIIAAPPNSSRRHPSESTATFAANVLTQLQELGLQAALIDIADDKHTVPLVLQAQSDYLLFLSASGKGGKSQDTFRWWLLGAADRKKVSSDEFSDGTSVMAAAKRIAEALSKMSVVK